VNKRSAKAVFGGLLAGMAGPIVRDIFLLLGNTFTEYTVNVYTRAQFPKVKRITNPLDRFFEKTRKAGSGNTGTDGTFPIDL
jgi:hypothetical protein